MTTIKTDAVIGISSFNHSETIASCRLWRRKVTTTTVASSFRTSGSLAAACTAIRRRTVHLNRQLGLNNETKNFKSTKNTIADEEFSAIHELIRLIGNVTFFDVLCRLTVKDSDVIQQLGTLLEYGNLRLDIAAAVIRLFGNLCDSKESAASVLQTKPCIRVIAQWLTKNLEDDRIDGDDQPEKSTDSTTSPANSAQYEKLREQAIRTLRNAASCGKNFALYLIRSESVYAVGRCIRYFDDDSSNDGKKKLFSKNVRENAFQFMNLLLPFKDHNFSQQLLRADISEKLMDLVKSTKNINQEGNVPAVVKLVWGMITHYSSLRVDLSKFGAIEWMKNEMEKTIDDDGKWLVEISKKNWFMNDGLIALIRFCRDAYTRSKLRESRALDLILKIFIHDEMKEMKFAHELVSAFLCFLYDDEGLKYLVEYDGFLISVIRIVEQFNADYPCLALHYAKEVDEEEIEEDEKEEPITPAEAVEEFRADSPSYKRFRLDPTLATSSGGDGETNLFEGPLCKDFTNPALSSAGWSSPSASPLRTIGSPSSPGPSWSPSASSLHSFSSIGSTSPPLNGNQRSGSNSCWSPTSDGYRSTDDWEYGWGQFDVGRRFSNASQEHTPAALCDCDLPSSNDETALSIYKDRERLLWSAVKLLSWLSHSVHAALLINGDFLSIFLSYVAGVCRPEPRIGRLIERLTRNRLFTESLLALEFHRLVNDTLCMAKCGNGNDTEKRCGRCKKLCKIGCAITNSFRAQVDTEFGFGTLEHMMATGDEKMKLKCLCAMLYLMRSNWRVRRLMAGERGGLKFLINTMASNENDVGMIGKAIFAGIDKGALREQFLRLSTLVSTTNTCNFPAIDPMDATSITFLENGQGGGRIDCNTNTLIETSPFFRAMFSGSYVEATKRSFVYDDGDNFRNNFSAFVFYIHFLHGCRNCSNTNLNSAIECLSVLELADKRLCHGLGELVVNEKVAKFLRSENIVEFISNAFLRRDTILYKLCMDFLFSHCTSEDFLNIVNIYRLTDLGKEFFQMLFNYLKVEFKFE